MANLPQLDLRIGFDDGQQRLFDGAVDCVKVDDTVLFFVLEIAKDCVDACYMCER